MPSTETCIENVQMALYSKLTTAVLSKRAAQHYDKETLTLAGKLLEQNPELYTVWNYRREALHDQLKVGIPDCLTVTPWWQALEHSALLHRQCRMCKAPSMAS